MVSRHHRKTSLIYLRQYVYGNAVHHMVGAAVDDDTLYIGQRLQFPCRNIMGINLAVNPHLPDVPGQLGVLRASQIQNHYHILFHLLPPSSFVLVFYFLHYTMPRAWLQAGMSCPGLSFGRCMKMDRTLHSCMALGPVHFYTVCFCPGLFYAVCFYPDQFYPGLFLSESILTRPILSGLIFIRTYFIQSSYPVHCA